MNRLHLVAFVMTVLIARCSGAHLSVATNRYNNSGTGANAQEHLLNASTVKPRSFGKLFSYDVDGAVYAQPLYVAGVKLPQGGVHNLVYVVTMSDRVYAFDADAAGPAIWTRDLTNVAAGITPVPIVDITHNDNLNIVGNVGILGTPVIDESSHSLYLVARTKENSMYVQRLHALDLRDGRERVAPVVIEAAVNSTASDAINGMVHFNPKTNNQRPALTLTKKKILIAWASHEDIKPYHGWIMAYDAKSLQQIAVFCTTSGGMEGGIWQSGRGAAVDHSGHIYYEVGNGDWNGTTDYGESLLKLGIRKGHFDVLDYYTPANYKALNKRDADFGSSGPTLIPNSDVIICGDKHGALTLLKTGHLGKLDRNATQPIQTLPLNGGRVLNGPVLWRSVTGLRLFIWGEADVLKAFRIQASGIDPAVLAKGTTASHGSPGGALTVSSDGAKVGTAVVWAMLTLNRSADHGNAPGVLRAFDAEDLKELWNSEIDPTRDRLGTLVKFVPPTVAAGRVYAATYDNRVAVYGTLDTTRSASPNAAAELPGR